MLLRDNLMAGITFGKKNLVGKCYVMAKKNVTPNFLPICDVHGMERPKNASAKCHLMTH